MAAASNGSEYLEFGGDTKADSIRRASDVERLMEDEEELVWEALSRLPSQKRTKMALVRRSASEATSSGDGQKRIEAIDVSVLSRSQRELVVRKALATSEQDNFRLLSGIKERLDRAGLELPKIEVRFENLSVTADVQVGSRALPTLVNYTRDMAEYVVTSLRLYHPKRHSLTILKDVSGYVKPGRMTLLLGPPGSGKSTLLLALAGKLAKNLKKTGDITYNGHKLDEFFVQRTSAYISQADNHIAEITVRETFDFAARCQGASDIFSGYLKDLELLEKEKNIRPNPEVDAFMKAASVGGEAHSTSTEYVLKVLGLDVCADTFVGSDMLRGVSGGQKKRVTSGEMMIGPRKALFMDEISTGLDSSTTYQITKCLGNFVHLMDATVLIALLQPAPETFDLFDDLILLSEGYIVYNGPRAEVLEFFESIGFQLPPRKGVADFLQEVTSKNDQAQYWADSSKPYMYMPSSQIAEAFKISRFGRSVNYTLSVPVDRQASHPSALAKTKYAIPMWETFTTCLEREIILIKRHWFLFIFRMCQMAFVGTVTATAFLKTRLHPTDEASGNLTLNGLFFGLVLMIFSGLSELSIMIFRLPVFYKQRENCFHPAWSWVVSNWLLRIPYSVIESVTWCCIVYYSMGLAPSPGRFFRYLFLLFSLHQMSMSLFNMTAALSRDMVIANTFGAASVFIIFVLGGFVIPKGLIKPWWSWAYWVSPLSYAQSAITINEFDATRWMKKSEISDSSVGVNFLRIHNLPSESYWYWIGVGVVIAYGFLFNAITTLALEYLNPITKAQVVVPDDSTKAESNGKAVQESELHAGSEKSEVKKRGMILPFEPLTMTFHNVNYFVDTPKEMSNQGVPEKKLRLLSKVSGVFSPGVLTALVGSSGAGKTTLMDVLAGRKTGGYIEGDIRISGYPKEQRTFARISGYVEQNDIHSSQVTVEESLWFSSSLRLPKEVTKEKKREFVDEVMKLVELDSLRNALVGLPGSSGLSTEQRKRLTIAVELVANPSIIFMDEPTSGLDARAAAIVMRTVRNTVDTGRTVVCTIHQPSIDIFEAFDELLLMKRGGLVIYGGKLGIHSQTMINYFQSINGVPPIRNGYNPATWMLEISTPSAEEKYGVDLADVYRNSDQYREVEASIKSLSVPSPGSQPLKFSTLYSEDAFSQFLICFRKQNLVYWRNPEYNAVRILFTTALSLIMGTVFWNVGSKRDTTENLFAVLGALYSTCVFLGIGNASSVQPVISIERAVFYREKAAGMYSPFPYALAQGLVEIPYILVQTILYGLITFLMIGFQRTLRKFVLYIAFMFLTFTYFTFYGMMAVGLTPSLPMAAILSSSFYALWNLFSGFLIPPPNIPGWWIWFYYICPISWTLKGVIVSQLGDIEGKIVGPGFEGTVKEYLKHSLGYEYNMMGYSAAVLIGFSIIFFCSFAISLRFLNFQRR